ncbi:MAG: hypothetical protein LBF68_01265 [Christensenellaceae bacterium]|jgi:hypothetical protein|nr:hypothetical protein [Christensenellaceae bacterium]
MLYSTLENLNVCSINDAKFFGKPEGVYIFKKTFMCGYIVLSHAEVNILPYANIYSSKDVIMIKSSYVLMRTNAIEDCFFLKPKNPVIDVDGSNFEELEDLELTGKSGYLICKTKKIKFNKIVSSSNDLIIVNTNSRSLVEQKSLNPSTHDKLIPIIDYLPPKKQLIERATTEVLLSAKPEYRDQVTQDLNTDYSFLIGRRVGKEIIDLTRTFIVKEGTVITTNLILSAKKAGKLADLTIHSAK